MVHRAGLVVHGQTWVGLRAHRPGLGPAAATGFGAGDDGLHLHLLRLGGPSDQFEQIQVLFGRFVSVARIARGRGQRRSRAAGAVQVVKPVQQLGLGLHAFGLGDAGLVGLFQGLQLFGCGRCAYRAANGGVGFLGAQ